MAIQSNNQREADEKTKSDDDDQDPYRNKTIDRLPHDVCIDTVCRLHITSLVQFRFVCRAWNKFSHDPQLVNLHMSRALNNDPCLIFHSRNHLYFVDLSDPENNDQVRGFTLPFSAILTEFNVVSSCNGLLCISTSLLCDALYIYNPFTRNYKELPKFSLAFERQRVAIGFGFHPSTKHYKVVKIVYYDPDTRYPNITCWSSIHSDVQILDLSSASSKWRSIGQAPELLDAPSTGVLVNGRLHWAQQRATIRRGVEMHYKVKIVSFELCDEGFEEIPSPDFRDYLTRNSCRYHISVLGGCLSIGLTNCFSNQTLRIWIMKEYNVKQSWQCVCSINSANWGVPEFQRLDMGQHGILNLRKDQSVRALCCLKNGEILLEFDGRTLVSYDPKTKEKRNLMLKGMPDFFKAVVHVGSLSWIHSSHS